jgi:cobalt/nickel transport system permease protein
MLGVHLLVGLVEGLVTVAVLGYLQQVRPDIVLDSLPGKARLSRYAVLITLLVFTVVISAGLSLLACGFPDGLEWSYAERPDQPDFKSAVENKDPRITAVDDFQSKYSPLPDYSARTSKLGATSGQVAETSAGWTSFAGVLGSALTMAFIWLIAWLLRKKQSAVVIK